MGFLFTPSGACGCCIPACANTALGFCGFTLSGDHSHFTSGASINSTFYPDPFPSDWSALSTTGCYGSYPFTSESGGWGTITLSGIVSGDRIYNYSGYVSGPPHGLNLTPQLTLPYAMAYTTSGSAHRNGLVFVPDPAPTGWVAGAFVGDQVTIAGSPYTITANNTASFTLSTAPTVSVSIAFTRNNARGFSITGGVFKPITGWDGSNPIYAPQGWFTDQLAGLKLAIIRSGRTYYDVVANTGNTLTLANPPPDGDYSSSYTWYLYDPTATNVVSTDWNMYPNGPHGLTTDYTTTGWIDGLFAGCSVTCDGTTGTITANDTQNLTVSNTFVNVAWSFADLIVSGEGPINGTAMTWGRGAKRCAAFPAGLPITINGKFYTIASGNAYNITVTEEIDTDFVWSIQPNAAGNYWDVISGTWSVLNGVLSSSGTGAKVIWHHPLKDSAGEDLLQYAFGVDIEPYTTDIAYRLFFGPDAAYSAELLLPAAGTGGSLTLTCGTQVATIPVQDPNYPYGYYGYGDYPLSVCIFKIGDDYHVVASYALDMGLELTVDNATWTAAPQKIGIGSDGSIGSWIVPYQNWLNGRAVMGYNSGSAASYGLLTYETRNDAFGESTGTDLTTKCNPCVRCYLPGQLSSIPAFSTTIPGLGTFGLVYHVRGTYPYKDLAGSACQWGYEPASPPTLGTGSGATTIHTICFNLARSIGNTGASYYPLPRGTQDRQTAFVGFNGDNCVNGYNYRGYIAFPTEAELMGETMMLTYVDGTWPNPLGYTPPEGWPTSITLVKV